MKDTLAASTRGKSKAGSKLNEPLLKVSNLTVEFDTFEGIVRAVNGISYELNEGEALAIVGESGSGKTAGVQAVLGIIDSPPGRITDGSILYRGLDLVRCKESERRKIRGEHISLIFQDALTALNPSLSVGFQISEALRTRRGMSKVQAKNRAIELLDRVQIPSARKRIDDYPHQFSGGMRQRVMIAVALALDPEVLIADEPTTALDVTVQAQVMELLQELRQEFDMALVLITHDLAVVANVTDRVAVMYGGRIVEEGSVSDVYRRPAHPYTEGLMRSIPTVAQRGKRLFAIPGSPPNLMELPRGCAFHDRCRYRRDRCATDDPPLYEVGEERLSACHYAEEVLLNA